MQQPEYVHQYYRPTATIQDFQKDLNTQCVPLHDLTDQSQQRLINTSSATNAKSSKWQALCKAFGLQVLYNVCKRLRTHVIEEAPKVAISKDRSLAALRGLIHLIPVSAAVTVIVINSLNYYIGGELAGWAGEDTQKLAALQLTAKLHELFMLASIAVVVFAYVRRELIANSGIPLGAIFAGLQTTNLSFLWSAEMWGILMTKWSVKHKKLTLLLTLVVATLLGLTVGPSTAILMRPRLDYWNAGGTKFWVNGSMDQLRPLVIDSDPSIEHCLDDTGDWTCPHGNWMSLEEELLSGWKNWHDRAGLADFWLVPGDKGSVIFKATFTSVRLYANARTMATGPPFYLTNIQNTLWPYWAQATTYTGNLVKSFKRYGYRQDNIFSISNVWQPGVHVVCRLDVLQNSPPSNMSFPDISTYDVPLGIGLVTNRPNYTSHAYDNPSAIADMVTLYNTHQHGVLWLDDPNLLKQSNSSINAVVSVAFSDNTTHLHFCSVDARHLPTTIQSSRSQKATEGIPQLDWLNNGIRNASCPQMTISSEWAQYLDARTSGTTVFSSIINNYYDVSLPSQFMESMLANLFANGLARVQMKQSLLGTLRTGPNNSLAFRNTWPWCIMPKSQYCTVDSAFDVDTETASEGTQLSFTAQNLGYSYSSQGITTILAMCVLSIYCIFAMSHFIYTVATGWTSTAWDSPAEIMALAMQSQSTGKLKNTGAGIETTAPFEERVHIRVNEGMLEYVFSDTKGESIKPEKNKKYS